MCETPGICLCAFAPGDLQAAAAELGCADGELITACLRRGSRGPRRDDRMPELPKAPVSWAIWSVSDCRIRISNGDVASTVAATFTVRRKGKNSLAQGLGQALGGQARDHPSGATTVHVGTRTPALGGLATAYGSSQTIDLAILIVLATGRSRSHRKGPFHGSPRSVAFNVPRFRVPVSTRTGKIKILKSVHAADAGQVINPMQSGTD